MSDRRRILIIGLGTIARTHLAVLGSREDVEVVGGVDPVAGPDLGFPTWTSYDDARAAGVDPDLVVVATPTDTHPELVREVLATSGARVLSEKPLVRDLATLRSLEAAVPALRERVAVAHHFAFSPEVGWARRQVAAHPEWGRPERILSVFNDPYGARTPTQLASYVSPWVDSGPNQLSLLGAFVGGWQLTSAQHEPHRSVTTLEHDGGVSVLASSWLAADTSKQTTLEFGGGTVQVRMDHTSMTGLVIRDGRVTEHAGYTGTLSRKDAHYAGLYDALLADPADPRLGVDLASGIARVLEAGESAAAGTPASHLSWTDVGR